MHFTRYIIGLAIAASLMLSGCTSGDEPKRRTAADERIMSDLDSAIDAQNGNDSPDADLRHERKRSLDAIFREPIRDDLGETVSLRKYHLITRTEVDGDNQVNIYTDLYAKEENRHHFAGIINQIVASEESWYGRINVYSGDGSLTAVKSDGVDRPLIYL